MTAQLKRHRGKPAIVVGTLAIAILGAGGWVLFGSDDGNEIQAIRQGSQIQFKIANDAIETMRTEIFNLGGQRLYDSGPTTGNSLQWPMTTEAGERVARGIYLYVIQAWGPNGELVKSRTGKVAVTPDGVGLGAREGNSHRDATAPTGSNTTVQAQETINGNLTVNGEIRSSDSGNNYTTIEAAGGRAGFNFIGNASPHDGDRAFFAFRTDKTPPDAVFSINDVSLDRWFAAFRFSYTENVLSLAGNTIESVEQLKINGSKSDLLALSNSGTGQTVFRAENDGDVFANGSYNCGQASGCFNAGQGADVAERITSSEAVESGDVVEIDPKHPNHFRKALGARSTHVAGVVSTKPGVTLGNAFGGNSQQWNDDRSLLALAGRVPVKVTTENGPIRVGDLLTTSSRSGHAMRCGDVTHCPGAVIGKALESPETDSGIIMAQVSLR
mgnify:CR=1 FL=1